MAEFSPGYYSNFFKKINELLKKKKVPLLLFTCSSLLELQQKVRSEVNWQKAEDI